MRLRLRGTRTRISVMGSNVSYRTDVLPFIRSVYTRETSRQKRRRRITAWLVHISFLSPFATRRARASVDKAGPVGTRRRRRRRRRRLFLSFSPSALTAEAFAHVLCLARVVRQNKIVSPRLLRSAVGSRGDSSGEPLVRATRSLVHHQLGHPARWIY